MSGAFGFKLITTFQIFKKNEPFRIRFLLNLLTKMFNVCRKIGHHLSYQIRATCRHGNLNVNNFNKILKLKIEDLCLMTRETISLYPFKEILFIHRDLEHIPKN